VSGQVPIDAIDRASTAPKIPQGPLRELLSRALSENEALTNELKALKAERTFEQAQASLMGPYANKVFIFVCVYCGVIAVFLLLNGFKPWGFNLSDAVLGIIAGSTAVSAIGLVGFVVSGLFRSPQPPDKK
jgi:hypothetical protein